MRVWPKQFVSLISKEMDLGKTVKNSGYYLGSSLIGIALSFISFPVYAILLSKEQFGILAFFSAAGSILTPFSILSLTNYYIVRSGELSAEARKKLLNDLIVFNFLWNCILVVLGGTILFLYLEFTGSQIDFFPNAPLMFIILISQSFLSFKSVEYRMNRDGLRYFLLQTTQIIGNVVMGVGFVWYFNAGATGKLAGICLSNLILFLTLGFGMIRSSTRINLRQVMTGLREMKELTMASFVHSTVPSADVMVLETYNNLAGLGIYNVGKQIANFVSLAGSSLFQAFEPKLYQDLRSGSIRDSLSFRLFVGSNIALLLLYFMFSDWIIGLLTAGRFYESLQFSNLFVFQAFSSSINQALQIKLFILKRVKLIALVNIIGSTSTFILMFPLISGFFFTGAAVAFLLSSVLQMIIYIALSVIYDRN